MRVWCLVFTRESSDCFSVS